jgi:NAD(P)-dependent dehydrogenase (short-subunit alcohol dehydrogenase family)
MTSFQVSEDLAGTAGFITGAASGLGEATARVFAAAGAAVACVDRDEGNAQRVCSQIEQAGGRGMALGLDVRDAGAVRAAVDCVIGRFGRLDFAVNCAAIDHVLSVADMTVEQWDDVVAVNLRGPFTVAKAVLPQMQRQGSGHIVNIASTAATRAWANASAYHASKWGLLGFGRALGVEGRAYGIRVTTVIPGGMRTHFFDRFPEQGIPLPDDTNLQDPVNVARAILFAVQLPPGSALQEMIITPLTETSWP